MNINKVFVCDIYRIDFCVEEGQSINRLTFDNEFGLFKFTNMKVSFVKKALVYYSFLHDCHIDLETKEKYRFGIPDLIDDKKLFIATFKDLVCGSELMGTNKKHYTKKKILRKYNEVKDMI